MAHDTTAPAARLAQSMRTDGDERRYLCSEHTALAREFDVSKTTICSIRKGRMWGHVS